MAKLINREYDLAPRFQNKGRGRGRGIQNGRYNKTNYYAEFPKATTTTRNNNAYAHLNKATITKKEDLNKATKTGNWNDISNKQATKSPNGIAQTKNKIGKCVTKNHEEISTIPINKKVNETNQNVWNNKSTLKKVRQGLFNDNAKNTENSQIKSENIRPPVAKINIETKKQENVVKNNIPNTKNKPIVKDNKAFVKPLKNAEIPNIVFMEELENENDDAELFYDLGGCNFQEESKQVENNGEKVGRMVLNITRQPTTFKTKTENEKNPGTEVGNASMDNNVQTTKEYPKTETLDSGNTETLSQNVGTNEIKGKNEIKTDHIQESLSSHVDGKNHENKIEQNTKFHEKNDKIKEKEHLNRNLRNKLNQNINPKESNEAVSKTNDIIRHLFKKVYNTEQQNNKDLSINSNKTEEAPKTLQKSKINSSKNNNNTETMKEKLPDNEEVETNSENEYDSLGESESSSDLSEMIYEDEKRNHVRKLNKTKLKATSRQHDKLVKDDFEWRERIEELPNSLFKPKEFKDFINPSGSFDDTKDKSFHLANRSLVEMSSFSSCSPKSNASESVSSQSSLSSEDEILDKRRRRKQESEHESTNEKPEITNVEHHGNIEDIKNWINKRVEQKYQALYEPTATNNSPTVKQLQHQKLWNPPKENKKQVTLLTFNAQPQNNIPPLMAFEETEVLSKSQRKKQRKTLREQDKEKENTKLESLENSLKQGFHIDPEELNRLDTEIQNNLKRNDTSDEEFPVIEKNQNITSLYQPIDDQNQNVNKKVLKSDRLEAVKSILAQESKQFCTTKNESDTTGENKGISEQANSSFATKIPENTEQKTNYAGALSKNIDQDKRIHAKNEPNDGVCKHSNNITGTSPQIKNQENAGPTNVPKPLFMHPPFQTRPPSPLPLNFPSSNQFPFLQPPPMLYTPPNHNNPLPLDIQMENYLQHHQQILNFIKVLQHKFLLEVRIEEKILIEQQLLHLIREEQFIKEKIYHVNFCQQQQKQELLRHQQLIQQHLKKQNEQQQNVRQKKQQQQDARQRNQQQQNAHQMNQQQQNTHQKTQQQQNAHQTNQQKQNAHQTNQQKQNAEKIKQQQQNNFEINQQLPKMNHQLHIHHIQINQQQQNAHKINLQKHHVHQINQQQIDAQKQNSKKIDQKQHNQNTTYQHINAQNMNQQLNAQRLNQQQQKQQVQPTNQQQPNNPIINPINQQQNLLRLNNNQQRLQRYQINQNELQQTNQKLLQEEEKEQQLLLEKKKQPKHHHQIEIEQTEISNHISDSNIDNEVLKQMNKLRNLHAHRKEAVKAKNNKTENKKSCPEQREYESEAAAFNGSWERKSLKRGSQNLDPINEEIEDDVLDKPLEEFPCKDSENVYEPMYIDPWMSPPKQPKRKQKEKIKKRKVMLKPNVKNITESPFYIFEKPLHGNCNKKKESSRMAKIREALKKLTKGKENDSCEAKKSKSEKYATATDNKKERYNIVLSQTNDDDLDLTNLKLTQDVADIPEWKIYGERVAKLMEDSSFEIKSCLFNEFDKKCYEECQKNILFRPINNLKVQYEEITPIIDNSHGLFNTFWSPNNKDDKAFFNNCMANARHCDREMIENLKKDFSKEFFDKINPIPVLC